MPPEVVISVRNISKIFEKKSTGKSDVFYALQNLSFDIEKGSIIGIVGENGSGKSTLLNILSGIMKPSSGEVMIKGKVGSILDIGTGMHPDLSGRENIFLKGRLHGMEKNEILDKFNDIIYFSGLEEFIDMPVKKYSSGMFLRLAFSILIFLKSDILLLDEVLSVGDSEFQKKCVNKIIDIAHSNRTVILVSHHIDFIANLTEKAILLQKGKLILNDQTPKVLIKMKKMSNELFLSTNENSYLINLDEEFLLKSFKILDNNYQEKKLFQRNEKIYFEMEYELFNNSNEYCFGFILQDESNMNILSLHNFEVNLEYKKSKGKYKVMWEFPANILGSKTFFCEITITKNNKVYKKLNNIHSFIVTDRLKVAGYDYKPPINLSTNIKITRL